MQNEVAGWDWLTDHVPCGQADAISANDLSDLLEMDRRELRKIIEKSRRAGILICGDNHGYYFPESADELRDYIRRVRSRIQTGSQCLAPFLRRVREIERGGGS